MKILSTLFFSLFSVLLHAQSTYTLSSPNGALTITLETNPRLTWQLSRQGQPLTDAAPLALHIEGMDPLGQGLTVLKADKSSIDRTVQPAVHQKSAVIAERYNELTLNCKGDWGVSFRAYDEGVAYRFFTNFPKAVTVTDETYIFRPTRCKTIFFPEEESFYSHNERISKQITPAELNERRMASLPTLVAFDGGIKVLLTESDLQDYPGLWLTGTSAKNGQLRGILPHFPKYRVELTDRDIQPTDRENYLAKTKGTRSYPWRLFLVTAKDADLLANQMPFLLAEPSRLAETGWIKPGKVAWDWWNNLNLIGVDFRAGINTATYKYFVDFAAENGLQYIILDEGWCENGMLSKIVPGLDMDELAAYAKQKNVGLILWVTWTSIDKQFDMVLPNLKKWEVKGLKIDFMQRDDQEAVQFYWRISEKAAKNQLLLDFHGAYKPAGLHRTWPNVLSYEGVYGLENAKWDGQKRIDPEHNVTIPFIRMSAGPMDYTPGAMFNAQKNDWSPNFNHPASLGTRCHELAKYVVYESPLQMLSDSPSNYKKEPECLKFLSAVPSTWEQSVPLAGAAGDYVAVARQAANGLWYVGAMTDWTPRKLELNTGFLPAGEYELEIYADGINADRDARDYRRSTGNLKSGAPLTADMAPGGGFVAVLRKL